MACLDLVAAAWFVDEVVEDSITCFETGLESEIRESLVTLFDNPLDSLTISRACFCFLGDASLDLVET